MQGTRGMFHQVFVASRILGKGRKLLVGCVGFGGGVSWCWKRHREHVEAFELLRTGLLEKSQLENPRGACAAQACLVVARMRSMFPPSPLPPRPPPSRELFWWRLGALGGRILSTAGGGPHVTWCCLSLSFDRLRGCV